MEDKVGHNVYHQLEQTCCLRLGSTMPKASSPPDNEDGGVWHAGVEQWPALHPLSKLCAIWLKSLFKKQK